MFCQRPRTLMRKSVSLAEDDLVAIDTRVGALRQKNHSLDTSCQVHNSKARNDLGPTSLRAGSTRQKKSSVSSFGSNLDSSKVPSESNPGERRKKFSLCSGSSYDSQLSSGGEQVQGASRQRKLSLVCLPTSNQSSSLSSPKVRHYSTNSINLKKKQYYTIIKSALCLSNPAIILVCPCLHQSSTTCDS